jgi:hypothetical protein
MYDVFFLSHGEPLADFHWNQLLKKAPHARRVDGIDGILNAHRHCAEISKTSNFFVIDADNEVLDVFNFTIKLPTYDKDFVHIWKAKNPLNGLIYGWGAIKLFPKKLLLNLEDMPIDMTTSFPLKIISVIGSITHFNTSPYDTWRSAFRECVKLSQSDAPESQERLKIWCSKAKGAYSDICLIGAKSGRDYGLTYKNESAMLSNINDWSWLKERYEELSNGRVKTGHCLYFV